MRRIWGSESGLGLEFGTPNLKAGQGQQLTVQWEGEISLGGGD